MHLIWEMWDFAYRQWRKMCYVSLHHPKIFTQPTILTSVLFVVIDIAHITLFQQPQKLQTNLVLWTENPLITKWTLSCHCSRMIDKYSKKKFNIHIQNNFRVLFTFAFDRQQRTSTVCVFVFVTITTTSKRTITTPRNNTETLYFITQLYLLKYCCFLFRLQINNSKDV